MKDRLQFRTRSFPVRVLYFCLTLLLPPTFPVHAALSPLTFEPQFGIPGYWMTLRGRDANAPGLQVKINGLPATLQAELPDRPKDPTLAYVLVPENAKTGPFTVNLANETSKSLGELIITPVIIGTLRVPVGMNARAYRVVSPFGASAVAADGTFRVPVFEKDPTPLWAVSADPAAPFQALVPSASSPVEINLLTTAASMVLDHPFLTTARSADLVTRWSIALARPEVALFADQIGTFYKGTGEHPLTSDVGYQKYDAAVASVLAALPAPVPPGGPAPQADPPPATYNANEFWDEHLFGLDATVVRTRAGDDDKPVPRLELANLSALSRSNLLADLVEIGVENGDIKGTGRKWLKDEVMLAATFDKKMKQRAGTVMLPFTTITSSLDVVGSLLKIGGGLVFDDNNHIRIPNDHEGIYLLRAYGGLGALPFANFKSQRKLISEIPGGNQKLATNVAAMALDIVMDVLKLLPVNQAQSPTFERLELEGGRAGVRAVQQTYQLREELKVVLPALIDGITQAVLATANGDTVDLSQVWSLIVDTAVTVARHALDVYFRNLAATAQAAFEHKAYYNWAFGLDESRRVTEFLTARVAKERIDRLATAFKRVNVLARAAAAGSIAERMLGIAGAPPLETALLFVGNPLGPKLLAVSPGFPVVGRSVTVSGSFLHPVNFETTAEFRRVGEEEGIPIPDWLPVPGSNSQIFFTLPEGATGRGVIHVEGNEGSGDSQPFEVREAPVITGFAPTQVRAKETLTVFGRGLSKPTTFSIGEGQPIAGINTEAAPDGSWVRFFSVPEDSTTGRVKLTIGTWPTALSAEPVTILPPINGGPTLSLAAVTVNSRARGAGGSRALTLDQAFALATGSLSADSLPRRPKDDNTCKPYASELVSGFPGPNARTQIIFNDYLNYCDTTAPPEAALPLTLQGDLETPKQVTLPLLVLQNGNLIMTDDTGGSALIETGALILRGDRIYMDSVRVVNAPQAGVVFAGARFATVNALTVENPGGDGVRFEMPVFQGEGKTPVPPEKNHILAATVKGSKRNGVRFDETARLNVVGTATVEGNAGGPGMLFGPGSDSNEVSVVAISGVTGGPGILINNSPNNKVTVNSAEFGGRIFGLADAGLRIRGAAARGNTVQYLNIGAAPDKADATTGNQIGIHLLDGANHNTLYPSRVVFSKTQGVLVEGAGTADNSITFAEVSDNALTGATVQGGAARNTLDLTVHGSPVGIHIAGTEGNTLLSPILFGNGTGLVLDQGTRFNTVTQAYVFGNAGDGVRLQDAGTAGNLITGNWVGTLPPGAQVQLPEGTVVTGNAGDGIAVRQGAARNQIGGVGGFFAADNTIGNNGGNGVTLDGAGTDGNRVGSNRIGVDIQGNARPNTLDGIRIAGEAKENIVGWDWLPTDNPNFDFAPHVKNNLHAGISILGAGTTGNRVLGSHFGFSPVGIFVGEGATDNTIGQAYPPRTSDPNAPRPPTVDVGGTTDTGIVLDAPGNRVLNASVGRADRPLATPGGPPEPSPVNPNATGILLTPKASDTLLANSDVFASTGDGVRILSPGNWVTTSAFGPTDPSLAGQFPGNGVALRLGDGASRNTLGAPSDSFMGSPNGGVPLNRINGSQGEGLFIGGAQTGGNAVRGNLFGATDGLQPLPNATAIRITGSPDNVIAGNSVQGSAGPGIRIEGPSAAGNVIAGNVIGSDATPNQVGIRIDGALSTRIGGVQTAPSGLFADAGNQIQLPAVQVNGGGYTGTSVLYNAFPGTGLAIQATGNAASLPAPVLTPLSPTLLRAEATGTNAPDSLLLQVYIEAAPPEPGLPSQLEILTEGTVQRSAPLIVTLPEPAPGAKLSATLTDTSTGATSAMSAPVTLPATDPSAGLDVTLAPGLTDRTVSPGQAGVVALALDLKAQGNVTFTGLGLKASGTGEDGLSVGRVRIGVAQPGSLDLDPAQPLLTDTPGFARNDGTLLLEGARLELSSGAARRLLVLYDIAEGAKDGTHIAGIGGGTGIGAMSTLTLSSAPVTGTFPLSGPVLTVKGGSDPVYDTGDVNGDGALDIVDPVLMLKYIVGLETFTPPQLAAGDVNKDLTLDVTDTVKVMRVIVGIDLPF